MSQEIYRSASCLLTEEDGIYTLWRYTWDNTTSTTTKPARTQEHTNLHEDLMWASYFTLLSQGRRATSSAELQNCTVLMYHYICAHPEILDSGAVELLSAHKPDLGTDLVVRFYPIHRQRIQVVIDKDDEDLYDTALPLGTPEALSSVLHTIYRYW